jgi:hypothetical protein
LSHRADEYERGAVLVAEFGEGADEEIAVFDGGGNDAEVGDDPRGFEGACACEACFGKCVRDDGNWRQGCAGRQVATKHF